MIELGSRGTLFITMCSYVSFFVGAYFFVRSQVGHQQIIPIKLGSKTSPEIPSRIYIYIYKEIYIYVYITFVTLSIKSCFPYHIFEFVPKWVMPRMSREHTAGWSFLRICGETHFLLSGHSKPIKTWKHIFHDFPLLVYGLCCIPPKKRWLNMVQPC